ncbi:MAG: class I SAM-dependent methyltransferase, partial [Granulosicoccaceae bacterium]
AFAEKGLEARALDISEVGLHLLELQAKRQGLAVSTQLEDLSNISIPEQSFDVLSCSYYLDRMVLQMMADSLRPRGLLYYETFNASLPRGRGPSNPDFLLQQGELLRCFGGLELLFYEELWGLTDDQGDTGVTRLIARRPSGV